MPPPEVLRAPSSVTHLAVAYDREPPGAPRALVPKLNRDGWGEAEAGLYRLAMPVAQALPMLVRCCAAAYEAASGTSHRLLQDVSTTHRPTGRR